VTPTLEQTSKKRHQDPLHGVTLKTIVTELTEYFGWEGLSNRIDIKCFKINPSINSSLKFLRKTPWQGKKLKIYI
jgi:uncharacterized protein (DUF2132 family)